MKENNGSKATIREVYETVKPLSDGLARIETKLEEFIKHYDINHKSIADDLVDTIIKNTAEHKSVIDCLNTKISIKAFVSWFSVAITLLGVPITVFTILKLIGVF